MPMAIGNQGMQDNAEPTGPPLHREVEEARSPKASQSQTKGPEGVESSKGRRAYVYGDANADRVKANALRVTRWHRSVTFRTKDGATLREACRALNEATDIWNEREAMVVLHVGAEDVACSDEPVEDLVQELHRSLASWRGKAPLHHFVLYGVPELSAAPRPLYDRCRAWNQVLRAVCQEGGPRVEFSSTNWTPGAEMPELVYHEEMANEIGQRLGRRLCAFLGLRASRQDHHRWRGGTASSAAILMVLEQAFRRLATEPGRIGIPKRQASTGSQ